MRVTDKQKNFIDETTMTIHDANEQDQNDASSI
jgi:hypothetical protein